MNIYRSFIEFANTDNYDDDWRIFANVFPDIVEDDKNLEQLLIKNIFINDKWIELKDEIKYLIEDELLLLAYSTHKILDEKSLWKEIVSIADNIIRASLFKSLWDDQMDSIELLPQAYTFLDDAQTIQHKENNSDADEYFDVDDLKPFERDIRRFHLDKDGLLEGLKYFNFRIYKPRVVVKRIPIVKQVDYFDPAIYKLIKTNPALLDTLDWRIFEEMLADILKTFGYSIDLTRKTKDGGVDVIAIKMDNDFGFHKYILQAKRYSQRVEVSPIRELLFLHSEQRASKSCLATTSAFTKGAWELAEKFRWTLELKDKEGILSWIDKVINIKET